MKKNSEKLEKKKNNIKCDMCENCPVFKIDKKLLKVYMYNYKNNIFECCVNEIFKENNEENIKCFMKRYYRSLDIDWKKTEEFYEQYKSQFRAIGIE